jgi:peptidoglycan/LPS O-acetylase OafA/YrhL
VAALATILALVPSNSVSDPWGFELKTILGTVGFALSGLVIYRSYHKKLEMQVTATRAGEIATQ